MSKKINNAFDKYPTRRPLKFRLPTSPVLDSDETLLSSPPTINIPSEVVGVIQKLKDLESRLDDIERKELLKDLDPFVAEVASMTGYWSEKIFSEEEYGQYIKEALLAMSIDNLPPAENNE